MKISQIINLVLLLLLFGVPLSGQVEIEWARNFGGSSNEVATSIQQTDDDGYIIAGYSDSNDKDVGGNNGFEDYWIIKLDSKGILIWERNFGGSGREQANDIQQTTDGGYIIAGYSDSNDGDVAGNIGDQDYWIVKLDSGGNLIWEHSYGSTDIDIATDVELTSDGGYIIAGTTWGNDGYVQENNGTEDYWIIKLDAVGDTIWTKNFGGMTEEVATSIQQTDDDGYILAGYSSSNDQDVGGNNGDTDYWIVKLDIDGNLIWQRNFGGSIREQADDIQQTIDGGYIVAGHSKSNDQDVSANNGDEDYWIVKLDIDGNLVWQRNFGGIGRDWTTSIQQTDDDGYIVAGYSIIGDENYWIVKLDINGNLVWQRKFGGSLRENANDIQQTTDGGYIIAGFSNSTDGDISGSRDNQDYWIVKLKPVPPIPEVNEYLANLEVTDTVGITDYFQIDSLGRDTLLLSIAKNGQDIGTVGDGTFEVHVDRDTGLVNLTTLIRDKAPELGIIDTALALDYFWNVIPNYTTELDTTLRLNFYFPAGDTAKLEAALGSSIRPTDLLFFKLSSETVDNPCEYLVLNMAVPEDARIVIYQNGEESSTSQWQLNSYRSNSLVGTMDLVDFSCGGIFAIRQITPSREILAITHFSLSPNPSKGTLQLRFASPKNGNLQVQVINARGEPLYQQQVFMVTGDNKMELSLGSTSPGMYFLILQNKQGKKISRKFIIQN